MAAEVLGIAQRPARRVLEEALVRQLESQDPELFAAAGKALAATHLDAIIERCESLLRRDNVRVRVAAAHLLVQLGRSEGYDLLARWLATETSLRLAIMIGANPIVVAPDELVVGLARRGLADESPSLRLDASRLLHRIPADRARLLAIEAIADEPDDAIQRRLQRFATAE